MPKLAIADCAQTFRTTVLQGQESEDDYLDSETKHPREVTTHLLAIGREARCELTARVAVEETHLLAQKGAEQSNPQISNEPLLSEPWSSNQCRVRVLSRNYIEGIFSTVVFC